FWACGRRSEHVLSGGSHGLFITVNFASASPPPWAFSSCGQVSGGHLNPAVTFAPLASSGRDRWRKFPVFFAFQTLGAFLGSAIIFGMYYDALWDSRENFNVDGKPVHSWHLRDLPWKSISQSSMASLISIIGTAALIVCILAIVDPYNNPIPQGLEAFTGGASWSWSSACRWASTPATPSTRARDLGPRIFSAMAGWGMQVFTVRNCWFLVPIFAPFLGTIIGVVVYQMMVGFHMEGEFRDKREAEEQNERVRLTSITANDHNKEKEVS
ncbi:hypothetical protein CRUP_009943, partial [Coryphaenoides rupestris]